MLGSARARDFMEMAARARLVAISDVRSPIVHQASRQQ